MAVFKNTLAEVRHWTASHLGDLVTAKVASGTTATAVLASTTPPQFYNKPDDYFNDNWYEAYCYAGTNIGESRLVTDWVNSTRTLTVSPVASAAYDTTSNLELHYMFYANEYLNAINMAIETLARRYFFEITDDDSLVLEITETNDGNDLNTYEYELPTEFLFIHRLTREGTKSGRKLTGTLSGTFTVGETVTGGTSGATAIVTYSGTGYILVREADDDFDVGETITGGTSAETCTLTESEYKTVGSGEFYEVIDPRSWHLVKDGTAPHSVSFNRNTFSIVDGLRIRIEGQTSQSKVTADTDYIYVKPDWLVAAAITHLPHSKIESNKLAPTLAWAQAIAARVPMSMVHPEARAVIE